MKRLILVFLWCSSSMVVCENESNDSIDVVQDIFDEQETAVFSHQKSSVVNDWIQENEYDEEDDYQYCLAEEDPSDNKESASLKVIKKYLAHVAIVWFVRMYICKEYFSSRVNSICDCIVTALKYPFSFFSK